MLVMNKITEAQKNQMLKMAQTWFVDTIAKKHLQNAKKLVNPAEFNINPFLTSYLARFLTGNNDPESIARVLVYARTLGTSISTSFGQNMQSFISSMRDILAEGSIVSGMDIEFIDQLDGHRKFCQLKAGPQTINKDDVETIDRAFTSVKNLSRTNNLRIPNDDLVIGILYGTPEKLSANYRKLRDVHHYNIYIGQEFWHRLTGEKDFYDQLIEAIDEASKEINAKSELEHIVKMLAETEEIKSISK